MLVGHIAVAFVGKRVVPNVSLGTLVLAAMAADLLWSLFLTLGIERMQILERGATLMKSVVVSDISISHSLLMDAIWGAAAAGAYLWLRRSPGGALVIFGAVLGHWLLDVASHNADMPLTPHGRRLFGLGLWNSLPATWVVEGGFWLLAVVFYARATSPRNRAGRYAFWIGIMVLTAAWYNNVAGPPPPPNQVADGISSLVFFSLTAAWAYWINRLRPVRVALPSGWS